MYKCEEYVCTYILLTAGTARERLRHVYSNPAYSSPCSKMTFCKKKKKFIEDVVVVIIVLTTSTQHDLAALTHNKQLFVRSLLHAKEIHQIRAYCSLFVISPNTSNECSTIGEVCVKGNLVDDGSGLGLYDRLLIR